MRYVVMPHVIDKDYYLGSMWAGVGICRCKLMSGLMCFPNGLFFQIYINQQIRRFSCEDP